jgi:hypothetical protein
MQQSKWQYRLEQAQVLICCLLAASIPFRFNTTAILIWPLVLCWLLLGRFRTMGKQLKTERAYWVWGIYYLLFALSFFYSADREQAGFEIVQKLSLILFPLVVGLGCFFDARQREKVMAAFTLGISGAGLFCMIRAAILWKTSGDPEVWFYHTLVSGLDPNAVYMAWYVVFSLGLLLLFPWQQFFTKKQAWLRWSFILLQFVFLVLLSSRLLLVLFFVVPLPLYLRRLYVDLKVSRGLVILSLCAAVVLVAGIAMTENPVRKRFDDVMSKDMHIVFLPDYRTDSQHFNNLTLRLFVWRVGLENIRDSNLLPYGAGLGDVHSIQNKRIEAYGIINMSDSSHPPPTLYNMNLHNMFLQTTMAIGLPGLITLIVLAFMPFFFLFQLPDWKSWLVFQVAGCAFMMQEAFFQTQAGVVFFSFFSMLFWVSVYERRGDPRGRSARTVDQ